MIESASNRIHLLERALDGLAVRQRAIAANIANQNTPGYRRVDVEFQKQLDQAARGGAFEPKVVQDKTPGGPDGNNVDAVAETGKLVRVELTYQVLTRALAQDVALRRAAIAGRA